MNGNDWQNLGTCKLDGKRAQSPIDIQQDASEEATRVWLNYPHLGRPVTLYNNGYSLAFTLPPTYKAGFGVTPNGEDLTRASTPSYRLWQVNFHSPSEHTLGGQRFSLEMQMVHQRVTGSRELAVVVVFFTESHGDINEFLDVVLQKGLPAKANDQVAINFVSRLPTEPHQAPGKDDLGFQRLLADSNFYSYTGSLTVPPCETQVKYYVRGDPVGASEAQLVKFQGTLQKTCPPNGNYRSIESNVAKDLKMVSSVDWIEVYAGRAKVEPFNIDLGKKSLSADEVLAERLTHASGLVASVRNSPKWRTLRVDDPPALRTLKNEFQQASLSLDSARDAKASAERDVMSAQSVYDASPGTVEKINQKWTVIAKTNELHAALKIYDTCQQDYNVAVKKIVKYLIETNATSTGEHAGMSASVGCKADDLEYTPQVELPHGLSASPFNTDLTTVFVKNGISIEKLAPSLQQPDGTPGQYPMPTKKNVITTTTVPPTEPPSKQVVVRLPIDASTISNLPQFEHDLAMAIANSSGIAADRVQVPEVRSIQMTPVVSTLSKITRHETSSLRGQRRNRTVG